MPRFAAARDAAELATFVVAALAALGGCAPVRSIPGALFAGVAAVAGLRVLLG